jgi:dipeptidyl aminopeptidase/acylaminoacyl peptidase
MAWAQDDRIAGTATARFYDALRAAGLKPEVHIFATGGHGFGMRAQGTSSDHWVDEFGYWLRAEGLLAAKH